jgi:hypothetical protein
MQNDDAARVEPAQRIGDVPIDLRFVMQPVNEYHIESGSVLFEKRIRVDVLNTRDAAGRIDAMLARALYALEVFAAHPNANLQIASVLSTADETIDQLSSGHERIRNRKRTRNCYFHSIGLEVD